MKVNPIGYGMLEIVAENDAERVWFGILLKEIEKNHRPFLSHYFRVDLEAVRKPSSTVVRILSSIRAVMKGRMTTGFKSVQHKMNIANL